VETTSQTAKSFILVVDDEEDPRSALYELLASEGYRVATCENAFEALKTVARERPALVITDLRMPIIDGMELLSKIKYASPATRVIVYTAYGDLSKFMETLDRGGYDLVPKGASNTQILSVVRHCLEKQGA
jgi:DNA-binding NtrC family response regulator